MLVQNLELSHPAWVNSEKNHWHDSQKGTESWRTFNMWTHFLVNRLLTWELAHWLVRFLSCHWAAGPARTIASVYSVQPVWEQVRSVSNLNRGCCTEQVCTSEAEKASTQKSAQKTHHVMARLHIFPDPMADERRLGGAVYQRHKLIFVILGKIFVFHLQSQKKAPKATAFQFNSISFA